MNKKKYSVIVVIYTVFNLVALVGFNINENKNNYENSNIYVENQEKIQESQSDNSLQQKENENKLKSESEEDIISEDSTKETKKNNNIKNRKNVTYESDIEISNKSNNNLNKEENSNQINKVFKVSAKEIISDLTPVEKAKVLFVCRKLTKKEYNEIREYLSYNNEKLGVTKVFDILENKLDEENLEEIVDIFSEYMDVDKIEEIN